jgi:hypothetical protein
MIDILKQHARERRLTVILFVAATLILIIVQWRIGAPAVESVPVAPVEPR